MGASTPLLIILKVFQTILAYLFLYVNLITCLVKKKWREGKREREGLLSKPLLIGLYLKIDLESVDIFMKFEYSHLHTTWCAWSSV